MHSAVKPVKHQLGRYKLKDIYMNKLSSHLCKMVLILACISFQVSAAQENDKHYVASVKLTILSTMLAGPGIGEWGFSAVVEVDGYRILFDTGNYPDTVLRNAKELGVDLASIEEVILSHNHGDHTGGLLRLREELRKMNRNALSRAHVGQGIFMERASRPAGWLGPDEFRSGYEKLGGTFVVHEAPVELRPGVWLTGQVPRVHDEKNYPLTGRIKTEAGEVLDTIPEDLSLVIETKQGFLLISGCGHAGIINTMQHAREIIRPDPVITAIGGFHLLNATEQQLNWTANMMKEFGVKEFIGAHCTGLNSVFSLRQALQLSHGHAVVGSVGTTYELGKGITAGPLERSGFEGF